MIAYTGNRPLNTWDKTTPSGQEYRDKHLTPDLYDLGREFGNATNDAGIEPVVTELVEEWYGYTGTPPMIPSINIRKGGGGMNKWNRLLAMLDQVFGFENKMKSTFKKVSQDFDEKTNEHVFVIEYRIRVGQGKKQGTQPVEQKPVENKPVRNEPAKNEQYPLLHDVNDRIAFPPPIE